MRTEPARDEQRLGLTPKLWLHRFAVFTALATWLLLAAGALVTSNDAGLSVPDWPLSYGNWMPPLAGGILYEHGHRMIAALVGVLTIVLAVWLWRQEPRRWVRHLGLAALLAVILQGILGGLTVLFLLPPPVSVAHACLAQLFFCTAVSLALVTSPSWRQEAPVLADAGSPRLPSLALLSSGSVFLQLLLGALLRHRVVGIEAHLAGAVVITGLAGWTAGCVFHRGLTSHGLGRTARWLLGLLLVQLGLGGGAYWIRVVIHDAPQPEPAMVALTVLHVTVGALVLAASVVLTWQAYRWVAPAQRVPELTSAAERATL